MKDSCAHFDIPYAAPENISKTSGHPTIFGMEQIKDQTVSFMKQKTCFKSIRGKSIGTAHTFLFTGRNTGFLKGDACHGQRIHHSVSNLFYNFKINFSNPIAYCNNMVYNDDSV